MCESYRDSIKYAKRLFLMTQSELNLLNTTTSQMSNDEEENDVKNSNQDDHQQHDSTKQSLNQLNV